MFETEQIKAKVQITGTLVFHDAEGREVGTIELRAEAPLLEEVKDGDQRSE